MVYCFKFVDRFLSRVFYKLGWFIAEETGYFIIVPLLLTCLCATGFQRLNYVDDPEYLFAPSNGQAKIERATIEEHFTVNYTYDFHPSRLTRNARHARVIIVAKDNGSLLRENIWADIMHVDEMVHNVTFEMEDRQHSYNNLCAIWDQKCFENDILGVGKLLPEFLNGTLRLTYPATLNADSFETYVFPLFCGGIELETEDLIKSVQAVSLAYFVRSDTEHDDVMGQVWEAKVLAMLQALDMEHIKLAFFMSKTLETELEANTMSVTPFFGMTVFIMICFVIMSVTMGDCVRSKPWLGNFGILCATLSTLAAFGLLCYFNLPFIGINMAAPFLMLGIGIDDTFVMLASWRRTNLQDSVAKRLADTYSDAAVSITITSITDMLSFYIGALTPFPSVQIFCVYTGTAVLFTYLWHITLFGAILALSGRMEAKNKHAVTLNKVLPVSQSKDKSWSYRMFCSGGISEEDPYNEEDNKPHIVMVFFRDYVAEFLNKPVVKACVILVFMCYFVGAIYGIMNLKEGLEKRKLSRYDSYSVDFYDAEDKYFREYPYRIQLVFTGDLTYTDNETQRQIMSVLDQIEAHANIADPFYTESWLRSWNKFLDRNAIDFDINVTDDKSFIDNLKDFYLVGSGNNYALDVRFNEEGDKIIASRFIVQGYNVFDSETDRQLMEDLRKIAHDSPLNVTVFHQFFIFFDQFSLIRITSIQTICLAAGVMMVVSLILIPNPLCSLWIAFSIISIEIGVIGYMALWDVYLDSISMIQLIMCIGFSVDFSAHISYAYLAAKADTPDGRVKECLYSLGLPIVQGGLSTIISIVPLVLAPSYIFVTFFKTVFLVIFFGATHGIFLLPVLLSLIGPGSCGKSSKKKTSMSNDSYIDAMGRIEFNAENNHKKSNTDSDITMTIVQQQNANVRYSSSRSSDNSKYGDTKLDGGSIEKDSGHETSGEDTSEASSQKVDIREEHKDFETDVVDSPNNRNTYTNNAYVGDEFEIEERRDRERRGHYFGQWEELQAPRSYRPNRSHPSDHRKRSSSSSYNDRQSYESSSIANKRRSNYRF